MGRLIDADALGNRLYHEVFEKDSEDQRWDSGCWMRYRLFEKVLREQPTVEQPEIIRCRECKYAEVADKEDSQDGYTCQFHRGSIWFGGSYCSWAERREVADGNTD